MNRSISIHTSIGSPWIHSATYDLLFFSAFWWMPVCFTAFLILGPWLGGSLLFVLFQLVLRLPHFVATIPATYLRKENWTHYRQHGFKFGVVPVAILLIYFLWGSNSQRTPVSIFLSALSVIWGLQHIAFQSYGILQIYHERAQLSTLAVCRWEKTIFILVFANSTLFHVLIKKLLHNFLDQYVRGSIFNFPVSTESIFEFAQRGVYSVLILIVVLYVYQLAKAGRKAWPGLIFMLAALASMIYWPLYDRFGDNMGSMLFFYMYNGLHSLSYLGLIYYMMRKREIDARGLSPEESFSGRKAMTFFASLLGVSALIVGFMAYEHSFGEPSFSVADLSDARFRLFAGLEGFYVVHYYLESISWKFSDPHVRVATFPLLKAVVRNKLVSDEIASSYVPFLNT